MKTNVFAFFIIVGIITGVGAGNLASGQNFGVGGGPSMLVLGGDAGGNGTSIGLGARVRYNTSDIWGFVIGLYYHLPNKATSEITLSPLNPTDQMATFDYEGKFSIFRAYLHLHYYFVNNGEEDFGMYSVGGAGLFAQGMKFEVLGCDENKYSCADYNLTKNFSEIALSLGFGFNVPLETFHIYAEGLFNLPYSDIAGEEITINSSLEVNLGFIYILSE